MPHGPADTLPLPVVDGCTCQWRSSAFNIHPIGALVPGEQPVDDVQGDGCTVVEDHVGDSGTEIADVLPAEEFAGTGVGHISTKTFMELFAMSPCLFGHATRGMLASEPKVPSW